MAEILDLFGGRAPAAPPPVPRVTFHSRAHQRSIRGEPDETCGHCQINADNFRRGKTVGTWRTKSDVVVLTAAVLITQRDGSTLRLCAQHAQEHEQRGNNHG